MVVLYLPKLVVFICIGIVSAEGVDPTIDVDGFMLRGNWFFDCSVTDMPPTGSVEFSKVSPGEPFIIETQTDKYKIISRTSGYNFLIIKGFTKEDEGSYQCTVRDGDKQWISEEFYMAYKVKTSIERIPLRHRLDLGQEFNLTCEALGYPLPTVYWGKEGSDFHSEGPVLHFASFSEEDSGKYFCIADNHIDKAARVETELQVYYFPPVLTAVNTTITSGREWGKYVELRCVVDGCPIPRVKYWKLTNGVWELVPNDRRKYLHNSNYIDDPKPDDVHHFATKKWHILFITELEITDSGTYYCTAENRLGREEQEFTVLVV